MSPWPGAGLSPTRLSAAQSRAPRPRRNRASPRALSRSTRLGARPTGSSRPGSLRPRSICLCRQPRETRGARSWIRAPAMASEPFLAQALSPKHLPAARSRSVWTLPSGPSKLAQSRGKKLARNMPEGAPRAVHLLRPDLLASGAKVPQRGRPADVWWPPPHSPGRAPGRELRALGLVPRTRTPLGRDVPAPSGADGPPARCNLPRALPGIPRPDPYGTDLSSSAFPAR